MLMNYRPSIRMPELPAAFPMSTDSVLLSRFAVLHSGERVCDLGAGVGTLSMLLSELKPDCSFTGFELSGEAVALSSSVLEENGFGNVEIRLCDLRESDALKTQGKFDAAVSNPPYYPAGSGAAAKNAERMLQRSEATLPLPDLCRAAAGLLKYGGRFFLVHKPERLADLAFHLRENGLEPKRIRFVKKKADAAPSLLLMECRKGGKAGLQYEKDLVLCKEGGSPSEEYLQIYGIGENEPCQEP